MSIIPKNFEEWKICIEKKCGIPLTFQFAKKRLAIYQDYSHPETIRFIEKYGIAHYQRVCGWFSTVIRTEEGKHGI